MQGSGKAGDNNPENSETIGNDKNPAVTDKSLEQLSEGQTLNIPGDSALSGVKSEQISEPDGSENFSFDLTMSSSSDDAVPSASNFSSTDSAAQTLPSAGSFGNTDESAQTLPSGGFSSAPEDRTLPSAGPVSSSQANSGRGSGISSGNATEQTIQISGSTDQTIASRPGSASGLGSHSSHAGSFTGGRGNSQSQPRSLDERHDLTVGGSGNISVNIRPRNIISSVMTDTISSELVPEPNSPNMADYEILCKLGEGGMGVVYTARQSSIDRPIALKVVKNTGRVDKRQKARFLLEAIVTGDLDHPNIVPVYDLGKDPQGNFFYAMKQVQGKPWDKEIKNLSLRENLDILLDVCNAIAFAHSRKVIHRDLKPENIMLGAYGEVLVMDWGLAVSVQQGGKAEPLGVGVGIAGTPAYMAPEMAGKDWKKLGFHSDVYLLGAMLYEIVTGKRPHKGRGAMECLKAAAANTITEAESDHELVEIALRAMATNPAERPASAKEFAALLKEYLAHEDSIRLAGRAAEGLQKALQSKDYNDFNAAIFGFREALELWPKNPKAFEGLAKAILALAQAAYDKGDFDLARSNLKADNSQHRQLLLQIEQAQSDSLRRQKLLSVCKKAVAALALLVIVISTIGYFMVTKERDKAVAQEKIAKKERDRAVEQEQIAQEARKAEKTQRVIAEAKKKEAEAANMQAQKSEQKAISALADLSVARTKEERARAQAKAQKLLAEQRKEEMEKIEATRENKWWVFAPTKAGIIQQQQADRAKDPLQKTIELPGKIPLVMQFIPAGSFGMGSRTDEPGRRGEEYLHRVEITHPFYMGKYEITRGQWQAVMDGKASAEQNAKSSLPMNSVTWKNINEKFLPALNRYAPSGWKFQLPSEAQWEWACRAGNNGIYNSKAAPEKLAWFYGSKVDSVQPVGGLQPNAWGLYDMHGNVAEVCADIYDEDFYSFSPLENPLNLKAGTYHVARGGAWRSQPESCRSATRNFVHPENEYDYCGVRVILVPKTGTK